MRTILFVLALAACTDHDHRGRTGQIDDTTGTVSGTVNPDDLTVDTFIDTLVHLDCSKAFTCEPQFDDPDNDFADLYGESLDDCVEGDQEWQDAIDIADGVDAGRISFDPDAAADCLNDPGFPATCSEYFDSYDYPDSCYEAYSGNIIAGGFCITSYDCYGWADCLSGTCTGPAFTATTRRRHRR